MSSFEGRVAVVTGAGGGIGRALALGLARRGARLALSDVDEAGLAETGSAAQALGTDVLLTRVDVSDRAAVAEHAEEVVARFGQVNQLYNNAGIAFTRSVLESELADYDRVLGVNLLGVIAHTKAFLPLLIASGDGHLVNVSSLNGFMAQGQLSHYVASKFAVRGFTEAVRIEMLEARHPVRVTVVHPGGVRTSIATSAASSAKALGRGAPGDEIFAQRHTEKLQKMTPDDAARIVLDGVAKDRPRVLVGNDARFVDAVVRVFASSYPRAVVQWARRVM